MSEDIFHGKNIFMEDFYHGKVLEEEMSRALEDYEQIVPPEIHTILESTDRENRVGIQFPGDHDRIYIYDAITWEDAARRMADTEIAMEKGLSEEQIEGEIQKGMLSFETGQDRMTRYDILPINSTPYNGEISHAMANPRQEEKVNLYFGRGLESDFPAKIIYKSQADDFGRTPEL